MKQQTVRQSLPDEILSPLPQPFRSALLSMYKREPQLGADGQQHSLDGTLIFRELGMWLYDLCRQVKPKNTLEIGLANGYSTVYFLAAIRENGLGLHSAVDPFQMTHWHGIGQSRSQILGMSDSFRFIDEKSVSALVHFADRGETFEVIYIDGNHRFDDTFVDFTLAAEVCPMGGRIVLDDMSMPSIHRAVAFIRSNRKDFEEIETPVANIAAFRRIGWDTREWDHYVDFCTFDTYDMLAPIRRLAPATLRRGAKAFVRFVKP
jgi:predicted O-methyltransferase YrrM